jgi:4'-phosphopantetheinyl transferase
MTFRVLRPTFQPVSNEASGRRDPPPAGEVHVYFARPEREDASAIERAYELLPADERERAERFRFEHDRLIYVVAHALLRRELARYTGIAAGELRFERNQSGRPELAFPVQVDPTVARLRFNLAHTRGLVGCAVTTSSDVGFDVEEVRERAPLEIADRYFSRPELERLHALGTAEQRRRFFTLWSLKEAYLKARGVGLASGLDSFALHPREDGTAELETFESRPSDRRPWSFHWWHFEKQCAAVAVQAAPDRLRQVVFEEEAF